MIELMKYTYLMEPEKIEGELQKLWEEYTSIINNKNSSWDEINEARAILYLTGQIYCEQIAVEAIKRRLHLLKQPVDLLEFFNLIDKNSNRLNELREDELFKKIEKFYKIIKEYKNKYIDGKYYLEEEKFIEIYNKLNPEKNSKMGYKGEFKEKIHKDNSHTSNSSKNNFFLAKIFLL
ncbi:MAG: hypothetical protein ABH804_00085 [archaeon]